MQPWGLIAGTAWSLWSPQEGGKDGCEAICTQSSDRKRTPHGCAEVICGSLRDHGNRGGRMTFCNCVQGCRAGPLHWNLCSHPAPPLKGPGALCCDLWAGAHSIALPLTKGAACPGKSRQVRARTRKKKPGNVFRAPASPAESCVHPQPSSILQGLRSCVSCPKCCRCSPPAGDKSPVWKLGQEQRTGPSLG